MCGRSPLSPALAHRRIPHRRGSRARRQRLQGSQGASRRHRRSRRPPAPLTGTFPFGVADASGRQTAGTRFESVRKTFFLSVSFSRRKTTTTTRSDRRLRPRDPETHRSSASRPATSSSPSAVTRSSTPSSRRPSPAVVSSPTSTSPSSTSPPRSPTKRGESARLRRDARPSARRSPNCTGHRRPAGARSRAATRPGNATRGPRSLGRLPWRASDVFARPSEKKKTRGKKKRRVTRFRRGRRFRAGRATSRPLSDTSSSRDSDELV